MIEKVVEKINNISNKKILIITGTFMILTMLIGFSYAYWSNTHMQESTNEIAFKCFHIDVEEENPGITQDNVSPQTEDQGKNNSPYKVTITNTCEKSVSYKVLIHNIKPADVEESEILADKYVKINYQEYKDGLEQENNTMLLSEIEEVEPIIKVENATSSKEIGEGTLKGNETKIIYVRSWMEEKTPPEEGANKKFIYKITIEGDLIKGPTLSEAILANNEITLDTPDFRYGEPVTWESSSYYPEIGDGGLYEWEAGDDSGEGIVYYFRGNVENNYVKLGTGSYRKREWLEGIAWRYYYDIKGNTYSDWYDAVGFCYQNYDDYGYWRANDCINDIYSYTNGYDSYDYIDLGSLTTGDLLWRIVRINGDGSVRLILDGAIGTNSFNSQYTNAKFTGYTYDNESACTKNDPCESTFDVNNKTFINSKNGQNSSIKQYLETWYTNNLSPYDDKIELGRYCNDVSTSGFSNREGTPSLKCLDDTSKMYGGSYQLKIGLLSADEINMAGYGVKTPGTDSDNYLYVYNQWWSMSPSFKRPYEIYFATGTSHRGYINTVTNVNTTLYVRPVINIKADEIFTTANPDAEAGTIDNPYILQE